MQLWREAHLQLHLLWVGETKFCCCYKCQNGPRQRTSPTKATFHRFKLPVEHTWPQVLSSVRWAEKKARKGHILTSKNQNFTTQLWSIPLIRTHNKLNLLIQMFTIRPMTFEIFEVSRCSCSSSCYSGYQKHEEQASTLGVHKHPWIKHLNYPMPFLLHPIVRFLNTSCCPSWHDERSKSHKCPETLAPLHQPCENDSPTYLHPNNIYHIVLLHNISQFPKSWNRRTKNMNCWNERNTLMNSLKFCWGSLISLWLLDIVHTSKSVPMLCC